MLAESSHAWRGALSPRKWCNPRRTGFCSSTVRASQSMEEKNKVFKELGLFSLKKKIEDVVARAEMVAPAALELEEARRIKQEEMLGEYNPWDDLAKSSESLIDLDNSIKVINALKDLQYKTEEVKLITQLAEMDLINHKLFKEAYDASLDVSKFLDYYEMSKLLHDLYDKDGACMIIRAGTEGHSSQMFAGKLLCMYLKWAKKQQCNGRVVEKCLGKGGGIKSATVEFESKFFYGYLSGEEGAHKMIRCSPDRSIVHETCSAGVEVVPIFLESAPDPHIDEEQLEILFLSAHEHSQHGGEAQLAVRIHHKPTGITVQCSGERNHFTNKMKARNRLKAKLLVVAKKQGVSNVTDINRELVKDVFNYETRRYIFHPHKLVQDMRTGFQLAGVSSVLDGNIEPFLRANISLRKGRELG